MLKFDKKTQTTTTEIITIQPGTYYFKENIEDTDYYRKYNVGEENFRSILCIVTSSIKSVRFEEEEFTNWPMERCFGGDKNVTKIGKLDFEHKFMEAMNFIKKLPL